MQGYQNYKETDIGWLGCVPTHWQKNKFKFLLREKGKTQNVDLPCGSISFGKVVYKDSEKLTEETKLAYQEVLSGEFLVNPLNLNYDLKSLRTALSVIDVIVSSGYIVLQSENVVEENYLKWLLFVFDIRHMKTLGAGIRQTITFKDIGNCTAYVPSEDEQESIANFLDRETARIDNLIAEKQTFINLLKEKRQALISHVVTKGLDPNVIMKDSGIESIGLVPQHWAICKISYRYEILLGKMLDEKKITGEHLGHYLRNTDVQWDKVNNENLPQMDFRPEEIDRYQVRKGDLLVCEGGEIGRCAVWDFDEPCFYQKALHRVRPYSYKKDHTRFLFYVISDAVNQERFVSRANKATIAHLPAETFRQYRFAFPEFEEQVKIATYLDGEKRKFDRLLEEAKESIRLLIEHRTALISAAVTGKIDVRNYKEEAA